MSDKKRIQKKAFVSAEDDARRQKVHKVGHGLAFTDQEFMLQEECRPVRLQLELLRPELELQKAGVEDTIVFFGSARIPPKEKAQAELDVAQHALEANPDDPERQRAVKHAQNQLDNSGYLDEARKLAASAASCSRCNLTVLTGGGPSFMAAANQGAQDAGKKSVALNMMLPNEQSANEYVTPELTFEFHYFAIRKMHFLMRAKIAVAFPGGFGTLDELFELLTLIQTQKVEPMPILLFNKRFWDNILNFEGLVEEGTISEKDLSLFQFVETADEAWEFITNFYELDE